MTLQINTPSGARDLTSEEQVVARAGLAAAAQDHTHALLMTTDERTKLGALPTAAELATAQAAQDTAIGGKAPASHTHTPASIGAATEAQGSKADTALQPGALPAGTTVTANQVSDAGAAGRDLLRMAALPEIKASVSEDQTAPGATGQVSIEPMGSNGIIGQPPTTYLNGETPMRLRVTRNTVDDHGGKDFMIQPYQWGMAINYFGVVECWVKEFSIHRREAFPNFGGQAANPGLTEEPNDGAHFWVGDDTDSGGLHVTARDVSPSTGNHVWLIAERFGTSRASHGDMRLMVRNATDKIGFWGGAAGSEIEWMAVGGDGKLYLRGMPWRPDLPQRAALRFSGATSNVWYSADSAQLSQVGNFELVARLSLDNWASGSLQGVANKDQNGNTSFRFGVTGSGQIRVDLAGAVSVAPNVYTSTAAVPFTAGQRGWIRLTRVASTGQIVFYYAADRDTEPTPSIWAQLGTPVTGMTGDILDYTQDLTVGCFIAKDTLPMTGELLRFILRNGAGPGSTVAADFRGDHVGPLRLKDAAGNTWSSLGSAWSDVY